MFDEIMILSCKITFVSLYDAMAVSKVNFRFGKIPPPLFGKKMGFSQ